MEKYKGCISWAKHSCSKPKVLYGSDVKSDSPIELTISTCEDEWKLSKRKFLRQDTLISVELTPIQWAELLTSGSNYSGIPCTITQIGEEHIKGPKEADDLIQNFEMDVDCSIKEYSEALNNFADNLQTLVNENKLGKKALQELIDKMKQCAKRQPGDFRFLKERFENAMASVVAKAKAEVSSYVEMKVMETGMEALKNKMLFDNSKPQTEEK